MSEARPRRVGSRQAVSRQGALLRRTSRHPALLRRTSRLGLLTLALLLVAAPASADPAGPTHYDSRIDAVRAEDGGEVPAEFTVLGGDAFLHLRVERGTEAFVPGYEGEPYVRIDPDGRVEVNRRSPARWLNDARYGEAEVEVPPEADADAPPQWETVAEGGEYAWHDHRIHFMSPSLPAQVDPSADTAQHVYDWSVPVEVDGRAVEVTGQLRWVPGPGPVVPVALVSLAVVIGVAAALLRPGLVGPVAGVVALVTLVFGLARTIGVPPGTEAEPMLLVLPVLTLALVAIGMVVGRRDRGGMRGPLIAAAAGAPLLVWAVLQFWALSRPIVPGPLPTTVVRGLVAAALVAGAAGVVGVVRIVLSATSLDAEQTAG